jgi:hypothetical protein
LLNNARQVGSTTTGYLKLCIAAEMVGVGVDEDGMTAVSGLTGLQSTEGEYAEQDLSGARPQGAGGRAGTGGGRAWVGLVQATTARPVRLLRNWLAIVALGTGGARAWAAVGARKRGGMWQQAGAHRWIAACFCDCEAQCKR